MSASVAVVVGHRFGDAGNRKRADERLHGRGVGGHGFVGGGLADGVRHVDGEEVTGREELVDGAEPDVVGVDEVVALPPAALDGRIGFGAHVFGSGADEGMLPVGLVPHRRDGHPALPGGLESPELGLPFHAEAVADSHGELRDAAHSKPAVVPEDESGSALRAIHESPLRGDGFAILREP